MVTTQRIALAVGLLFGCTPTSEDTAQDSGQSYISQLNGDLLIVSQVADASVLFADFESGDVLGEFCLSDLASEECNGEIGFTCLAFEVGYRGGEDDRIQLAYAQRNPEVDGQPSTLLEIAMTEERTVEGRLNRLSFEQYLPTIYDGICSEEGVDDARCLMSMAHMYTPVPGSDLWAVADTRSARILFGEADFSSGLFEAVAVLDGTHPDWEGMVWVNNIDLFWENNRLYMINSFKGGGPLPDTSRNAGRIALWDVTDLSAIEKKWVYPAEGYVAAPHKATRVDLRGESILLYAHSLGASDSFEGVQSGSVGLARFSTEEAPTYLGDWVLQDQEAHMGFLRDVELMSDGERFLVTDSGCETLNAKCEESEEIFTMHVPSLPEPSGKQGSFSSSHDQQDFYPAELERWDILPTVRFPYEADLVPWEVLSDFQVNHKLGACPP